MQLGMIGLGRMGANMVRRLMKPATTASSTICTPEAVQGLGRRRAPSRPRRSRTSSTADAAARHLADGAGRVRRRRARDARPALAAGDIVIDGGNSYYRDDIAAPGSSTRKDIHYVDVGTSGGVCGLERGYCLMIGGEADVVARSRSRSSTRSPPASTRHRATPGRDEARRRPPSRATCTAGRAAPATSSRWSTTASSTA